MSIAKYIDHTILKPTASIKEIEKLCSEAKQYSFAAVCVPPYFVTLASSLLQGSNIKIATVIGFPFGYSDYLAKASEAKTAIKNGADELDMVMNIAAFRNGNFNYIKEEIKNILEVTKGSSKVLKVIIETGLLTEDEIIRCCELYKNYNIDFLKTSTGYAEKGASVEAVTLMRKHLPSHIQIKASGGIKTFEFANALINAGASRLGCSASVAIVNGQTGNTDGY